MQNPKRSNERIRIGLAGDVMIGRLVNAHLDSVASSSIWGNFLPILNSMDLNLINLETALTHSQKEVPKVFNFKADPQKVQALADASIDVVNLANNHVLDYSEEGLIETLDTLDDAGIRHVGAGKNIREASEPAIIDIKEIKVGILGCTDNEPSWLATSIKPGVKFLEVGEIDSIKKNILELRSKVDLLILSIHWGPNMRERPDPESIRFAHDLVDMGVDIIHGHSAHIFQRVEEYHGRIILYDTGDFVDDYYVDPYLRNDRSFFFIAEAGKDGIVSLRLIPALIKNFQVNLAAGDDAQEALKRMQLLSKESNTKLEKVKGELVLTITR